MTITGLRADARAAGCIIVEADGARIASLPVEVIREMRLEVGTELTPTQQERVMHASSVEGARRVALRLLSTRPRAVQDLKRRLRDRGHGPVAINESVERLEAAGLLNDRDFACHYVRVRGSRGMGPSRLIHDLLAMGVERRVAEDAVREVGLAEGVDVNEAARAVAVRRVAMLNDLPPARRRRRLLVYLARRGFRGADVRKMVGQLLGGEN